MHVNSIDTASQTALHLPLRIAISAYCFSLSEKVHGIQDTLRMCTAIQREMYLRAIESDIEMKRHRTYNVMWWYVLGVSVALGKL